MLIRLTIFFAVKGGETIQSAQTRLGADCGSDHELLIAKFRHKLKKVGKTTRPFDLNQITYDYLHVENFSETALESCPKGRFQATTCIYQGRPL